MCKVCARPLHKSETSAGVCSTVACRVRLAREEGQKAYKREVAENLNLREQAALRRRVGNAEAYPIYRLPMQREPVVLTAKRRLTSFRQHLVRIIEESYAGPDKPVTPSIAAATSPPSAAGAALESTALKACSLCRGSCCGGKAGEHAWLTADTIRRYRASHPDALAAQIVEDYARRIPARAYRNACFYQRPGGCVLPRTMRSDTCNNFYCHNLQNFRYDAPVASTIRAFFVVREPNGVYKTRFVETAGA